MPSPIAHTTTGYIIYRLFRKRFPDNRRFGPIGKSLFLLIVTIFFSLLPDFDFMIGILRGDPENHHNHGTHSLLVGLIIALGIGGVVWLKSRSNFLGWFLIILLSYNSHSILDSFTQNNPGVMLIWPISSHRFASPVRLFYGVHWGDGWISVNHVWTIATESLFALLVIFLSELSTRYRFFERKRTSVDRYRSSRLPLHEE